MDDEREQIEVPELGVHPDYSLGRKHEPAMTMQDLAQPHADREGFREEWKL